MTQTVKVLHSYPQDAERIWALATDYDALAEVMRGIATFEGLPSGRAATGDKLDVMVSLFGRLPKQPYHMEVLLCDDVSMVMRSSEVGAGVKSWRHQLSVVEQDDGCYLLDEIEIDAGWMTPLFAMWARFMYKARHKPRLAMLERGVF